MSAPQENGFERRVFLERLGAAAIGFGCFKDLAGFRAALVQARLEGKPLLTEGALNQVIKETKEKGHKVSKDTADEAKRDLKGFLKNRFTLTPDQDAAMSSIGEENLAKLKDAIEVGMAPHNELIIHIYRAGEAAKGTPGKGPNPGDVPAVVEPIVTVTSTVSSGTNPDGSTYQKTTKDTSIGC